MGEGELEWNHEDGYKWAELSPGFWGEEGFEKKGPASIGITFENTLTEEEIVENRVLMNGSGVAAGDVNGDGLVDLYFAQLNGPNRLYENVGGMRFKDVTESAGVSHTGRYSTGVAFADIDGDRDLDLIVGSLDKSTKIYENNGRGEFDKKKSEIGGGGTSTFALADIDSDGDLDLYSAKYKSKNERDKHKVGFIKPKNLTKKTGKNFVLKEKFEEDFELFAEGENLTVRQTGKRNVLYLNGGDGNLSKEESFEKRFVKKGKKKNETRKGWTLTASFRDVNGDMKPDLYTCNDFWTKDNLWINRGNGVFENAGSPSLPKISYSSMGVEFMDVNRDYNTDIFVTEMLSTENKSRKTQKINKTPFVSKIDGGNIQRQYVQNTLQINRGDNTFSEVSFYSGVEATDWSWGAISVDVNLDGYEDVLVNTGNALDLRDLDTPQTLGKRLSRGAISDDYILEYPSLTANNILLKNMGNTKFQNKSGDWGFTAQDISHGLASADLDNDGDLDLVLNRLNQVAAVYENTGTAPRIAVRLRGTPPNTQAIGAKVELEGGGVPQRDEIEAGGNYASSSDPLVVFAADPNNRDHTLTITWPDGRKSEIEGIRANRIYQVSKSEVATSMSPDHNDTQTGDLQFRDVSSRVSHEHNESPFDDFKYQPLLPIKLSQLGPGVSWIDFNRDGHDDLFVGGSRGSEMGVFLSDGDGTFSSIEVEDLSDPAEGDQTSIVGWSDRFGQHLVVGRSNFELGSSSAPAAVHYTFNEGKLTGKEPIPGIRSSTGPLAVADYDGDQDVDLFVGARFRPIRYPRDARSRLFRYEEGSFQLDRANSRTLQDAGLISGAVFTDFDQDGDQDLVLSREWDSILLLENVDGHFRDVSSKMGLSKLKGRWNGIATGDFNGDGWPDIIATNWGLNSVYQMGSGPPLKVYYDDFDYDKRVEIIEAYYNEDKGAYMPRRQLRHLDRAMPKFTGRIKSNDKYSRMSVGEIMNIEPKKIPSKEINTIESFVFINKKDTLEGHTLPTTAQLTTAFDPVVADFNNDGNEDVFLSQNFFAQPLMVPRQDAGRGVLLEGNDKGDFETVPGHVSGIQVYGEQRSAASSDLNGDGRVDLAVSQNEDSTKLYINQTEERGLRVRLKGPADNLDGIGSSLRLVYLDGTKGPRREIQAGSGYWSQSSLDPVLGMARRPVKLEITWSDGTKQTVPIPTVQGSPRTHEIEVTYPGETE